MSSLVIKVCGIDEVRAHPNADRLDIAVVGGWQCVVPKGRYKDGDSIVYFPPDTMLPREWAERFGVTNYLSFQKDTPDMGRIRCAKLRGEPSFGLVVDPDDTGWPVGADVAEHYGATKYEPPLRASAGDAEHDHPLFVGYTNIENLRNFPGVLRDGEPVYISEKIHGTNCRVGMIEGELMAGSHRMRRKRPDDLASGTYWFPLTVPGVKALLDDLGVEHKQVILFGEVYGKGVQCLDYGQKGLALAAFDLLIDGKYLNPEAFLDVAHDYSIPHVPMLSLWGQPFGIELVCALASGKATWGNHIREGVVIKPLHERTDPRIGRVVLKYISDDYLLKHFDEFADQ